MQPTEEQRKQWEEKIKNMSPEELQQLQKQQCVFCQIIAGKVPSKKVYEDPICLAILDINPAAKGHLLLLPKEHYAIMPQVPEKVLRHLSIITKNLSPVLLKGVRADGTTVFIANGAAAGQRAQHFIFHLIPRKSGDGVISAEERLVGAETAVKVKAAIEKKLLALLGGKKEMPPEIQPEEKPETEKQEKEKKDAEVQKAQEEQIAKPTSTKTASSSKPKKSKGPSSKQLLKKSSEPQSGISKTKGSREASLDDIANLFK